MRKAVALFFILLCGATNALAQGRPTGAPDALSAWKDWVLYGYEERYYCPAVGAGVNCVWPMTLAMDLDSTGGRFTLAVDMFLEGAVILPGSAEAWPVDMVDANGAPLPVLRNLNLSNVPPQAWLPAGRHTLSGRFEWSQMPETITVPSGYALNLTVNGEKQNFPVMEDSAGQTILWLRQAEEAAVNEQSADSLSVTVNRLIIDSQPMILANRFRLTVTGQAREVTLSNALLQGTRATLLNSPLPAQLSGTELRVKVKPGVYEIVLESRSLNHSEAVGPAPEISQNSLWGREFWAFQAQPQLRLAEISGAEQIDPSQADIFEDWKQFPIYAPEPGAKLIFTDLRRGDPEAQPDQLKLARQCWLDYDGRGLSCRDQLTGALSRQWHLNTSQPFSLAQATLDGQAQVITEQIDSKGNAAPGLQLRAGALNLSADLRIDDFSGTLPASGWDHDLETEGQQINLPPGYKIFHARGADVLRAGGRGAGTWTGSWSTLDFFVVLIISIAVWKLYGLRWGALALVALIFCYQEQMAPRMVFLHLLATSALLRLLPPLSKIRLALRLWRLAATLTLIVLSSLFLINQARISIYPQLESPGAWYGDSVYSLLNPRDQRSYARTDMAQAPLAPPAPEPLEESELMLDAVMMEAPVAAMPSNMAVAKRSRTLEAPPQQQPATFAKSQIAPPDARVQNSLARPDWNWRSVALYYNGNVSAEQTVDFIFISPAVGRFLGLMRIALMTVFTLMMLVEGRVVIKRRLPAAAAAMMLALAVLLVPAPSAMAQENTFPSPQMLDEFRTRLLAERQEPGGFPDVGFPQATLTLTENSLRLEMEVEAGRPTPWPLPSLDEEFFRYARVISGDGAALPLLEYSGLHTWLPAGKTRVVMEGPLRLPAGRDSFQLSFIRSASPVRLVANTPGFRVEGLEPDGRVRGDAINIFAANGAVEADPGDLGGSQVLEPFFIISRTVSMGLEWQLTTVVSRLVTNDAPVSLKVPLIPGEEPMGEEFRREGQEMTVNFAPGQEYVQWVSRLEAVPELTLTAADGPFTESWALDASPLWRVKYDGLTPIHTVNGGYWQPAWRPWPGEELRLTIDRPQPVPGVYRVIDKAQLTLEAAENLRNCTLQFTVRGSQAGPYSFTLPQGAEVKTFTVDGQSMPLAPASEAREDSGPTLTAPLSAGAHEIAATWVDENPLGTVLSTPAIDLGVPTANITISTRLAEDRWVLWTSGPLNGPAVQFWPLLAVLFLVCLFLARFKTPLSRSAWFLLGLGLIQLHIFGAMLVAGWLLALGQRAEWEKKWSPELYNFSQIVLALWTFLALGLIYSGIQYGLLANPDMLISGGGSYGQQLNWFSDRSVGPWPVGTVYSVSLWWYKAVMLAWSLWLAVNLIRWLKWGWKVFSGNGLWKKMGKIEAGEK